MQHRELYVNFKELLVRQTTLSPDAVDKLKARVSASLTKVNPSSLCPTSTNPPRSSKASEKRRKKTTKPTSTASPRPSKPTNAGSTPSFAGGSSSGTACGRRCSSFGARRACFRVRSRSLRGMRERMRGGWGRAGRGWGIRWGLEPGGKEVYCVVLLHLQRLLWLRHACGEIERERASRGASQELGKGRKSTSQQERLDCVVPIQPPGQEDGEQQY